MTLVKTGDAEIVDVYDLEEIDKDERKDALASALDKAKERISTKAAETDKEKAAGPGETEI
jgi:hypothetical protein